MACNGQAVMLMPVPVSAVFTDMLYCYFFPMISCIKTYLLILGSVHTHSFLNLHTIFRSCFKL